jgi:hypothetical protein
MAEDRDRAGSEPEEDRAGRAAAAADVEAHRTKGRTKGMEDETGDDVEAHRTKGRTKGMDDEAGDDVEAHRVIPRTKA